jgi:NAD(P)-dependent dehydrogenase (short-subunit alcohol dehydrogenase family)
MQTVLMTGANRGIGLEFCRQYADAGWQVLATCREPTKAEALNELARQYANMQVYALDVADFEQITALSRTLADMTVDVLLNNAGIYPDTSTTTFGHLNDQDWAQAFRVNTMAPVKLAEAFLPQIQRSQTRLLVSISSLMGSIADNTSGGSLLYRSSKAALNATMKSLAIDLKSAGIGVLILHPGWVKTDMGGQNALIHASESVSGMRLCIEGFLPAQSGCFFKYDGSLLPW